MGSQLGEFEQLLLFALVRLGGDSHGVMIRQEIERRTGRSVSAGAIYTAMDRLESRGFVSSRMGDPTPERGGRRKKLYDIEPRGAQALADSYGALQEMAKGLGAKIADLAASRPTTQAG